MLYTYIFTIAALLAWLVYEMQVNLKFLGFVICRSNFKTFAVFNKVTPLHIKAIECLNWFFGKSLF